MAYGEATDAQSARSTRSSVSHQTSYHVPTDSSPKRRLIFANIADIPSPGKASLPTPTSGGREAEDLPSSWVAEDSEAVAEEDSEEVASVEEVSEAVVQAADFKLRKKMKIRSI